MTERISVTALDPQSRRLVRPIRALMDCFVRRARGPAASLDVFLVNDRLVAQDVLSYPAMRDVPRPDRPPGFLGELYLNPSRIRREGGELSRFLAHGVLHLTGRTHERESGYRAMERAERRLRRICNITLSGSI